MVWEWETYRGFQWWIQPTSASSPAARRSTAVWLSFQTPSKGKPCFSPKMYNAVISYSSWHRLFSCICKTQNKDRTILLQKISCKWFIWHVSWIMSYDLFVWETGWKLSHCSTDTFSLCFSSKTWCVYNDYKTFLNQLLLVPLIRAIQNLIFSYLVLLGKQSYSHIIHPLIDWKYYFTNGIIHKLSKH